MGICLLDSSLSTQPAWAMSDGWNAGRSSDRLILKNVWYWATKRVSGQHLAISFLCRLWGRVRLCFFSVFPSFVDQSIVDSIHSQDVRHVLEAHGVLDCQELSVVRKEQGRRQYCVYFLQFDTVA